MSERTFKVRGVPYTRSAALLHAKADVCDAYRNHVSIWSSKDTEIALQDALSCLREIEASRPC